MNLKDYIATVHDFPIEGIVFRDITPLMADGEAFGEACNQMKEFAKSVGATLVAGPESRGFIFGCPVAKDMEIGFVPVRKPNKLPRKTVSIKYDLEYGSNELHMHADAVKKGDKVIIIDDLLATGGTLEAAVKLIKRCGAEVVGIGCVIELVDLNGKEKLNNVNIECLISY